MEDMRKQGASGFTDHDGGTKVLDRNSKDDRDKDSFLGYGKDVWELDGDGGHKRVWSLNMDQQG